MFNNSPDENGVNFTMLYIFLRAYIYKKLK